MVLISRVWSVNLHAYIVRYLHFQLNCELNKSTKIFRPLFSIYERSLQFLIVTLFDIFLPNPNQNNQIGMKNIQSLYIQSRELELA